MAPNKSLFSRARPRKPVEKKVRGFLALPGEIRNEVYRYHFLPALRCEMTAKGTKLVHDEPPVLKLCTGIVNRKDDAVYKYEKKARREELPTIRIDRVLGKYKRIHGLHTTWSRSYCGLILVCKQVYCEALNFLYRDTTFVFDAPRRIHNFLDVLPAKNLTYITKVQLHYTTYGNSWHGPIFEERHVAAWQEACSSITKKVINLRELEVWLYTTESPLYLDLRQSWLKPMLEFRRLSIGRSSAQYAARNLKLVNIHFSTYWSRRDVFYSKDLTTASRDLHRLFGKAVAQAILGSTETEAMADFIEAWEGKYVRFQHHLNFSYTGW